MIEIKLDISPEEGRLVAALMRDEPYWLDDDGLGEVNFCENHRLSVEEFCALGRIKGQIIKALRGE